MKKNQRNIRIIPLGGCGEIGMNMTIFLIEDRVFFVDAGALFPDASHIGVDLIMPDTSFIDQNLLKPDAWLITHGHEDHIGALSYLYKKYPAPVYGTEFTIELIRAKFEDAGISRAIFNVWKFYQPVLFRNLKVTPFPVNHSIADAAGLFLESKLGNILHMGDFRIDQNPPEKTMTHESLKKILTGKTVTLMMSDSTNSFQQGTDNSESDVLPSIANYLSTCKGAVIIATFASNVWRLQSIFRAAKSTKRKIVLFGRSMFRNSEIASRLGYLHYDPEDIIPISEAHKYAREKLCILCTGSQGEMFSGLSRLAWGSVSEFQVTLADTVLLSSRSIPGNEKAIDALVTQLSRLDCQVITAKEDRSIHVSGHGFKEDLKECIRIAQPKAFMPVHGTYRHLKQHRLLAMESGVMPENCFLAENGDVVVAGPEPVGVIDNVSSGRDYVCPGGIYSRDSFVYKERVSLVRSGVVTVSFCFSPDHKLLAPVGIACRGVSIDEKDLSIRCDKIFDNALQNKVKKGKNGGVPVLKEDIRLSVRKYLENKYGFKMTILVILNSISSK